MFVTIGLKGEVSERVRYRSHRLSEDREVRCKAGGGDQPQRHGL
jgi:hypothetical protein